MIEQLTKFIEEERKNPELTKKLVVPLSDVEKQKLREQFNENETKVLGKRITQLLPMFLFLKGPMEQAKELARAVSRIFLLYTEPMC